MKGEIDANQYPSRKYRCEVWTVTLFAFDFPLDNGRRRIVNAIKKMDGFVGWHDPKAFFNDKRGRVYFAMFDSEANAKKAISEIKDKFPSQYVNTVTIRIYAARDPIERETPDIKETLAEADFIIKKFNIGKNKGDSKK